VEPDASAERWDDEDLVAPAIAIAETLLRAANAGQTAAERSHAEKIARLVEDPAGRALTLALVDQAFRSHRPARIADQLRWLLARYGVPDYMEWWERAALAVGGMMAHYLPSVVVPPIVARLRHESRSVIVPGEEADLRRYLEERRRAGIRLNLNQLGEAILGEGEAARRLAAYLALLARDDVEYISVKVSSILSQIDLIAFRHTVELVKDRLRTLYREALRHLFRDHTGRGTPKFINLDMEEYRDLAPTMAAFQEVLDEPEFLSLRAGIVLQAYLPDSAGAQRTLTAWARARSDRGGAPIKLRIVKGANLAMERVEAALTGWPQTTYATKVEVDANYKRMLAYACRPEHARAVHVGIASHNLFDIGYGLALRAHHGVEDLVEFEMLEGMANHQARAVQARAGGLLLYAPVVKAEDFPARSRISSADSTRTPRPRTFCATCSISTRSRKPGRRSGSVFSPRCACGRPCRAHRGARKIVAPRRPVRSTRTGCGSRTRRSPTSPIPIGRCPRTARGSTVSSHAGARQCRPRFRSRSAARSRATPHGSTAKTRRFRERRPTPTRSRTPSRSTARSPSR
jgi:RHH-type proline utilization regulon transcriptional repressor/proline dehydrogenase/delta 1-pyrroline-5-carboxylate dehydrogenase